jgi:hypothetical protein
MARDGSGTYARVSNSFTAPISGTPISPTDADAFWDELDTEMTDSLSRSGKGGMSADLDMNSNNITEIGTLNGVGKLSFKSNGSTFAGSISTGQQWMLNASDVAPAAGPAVTISKNTAVLKDPSQGGAAKTNVALHLGTADASQGFCVFDNYGNASGPSMLFRSGRGTAASPTATQSGDFLFNFYAAGWGATVQAGFGAYMGAFALENWTDTAQGSAWVYYTNAIGAASITERVRIATGLMVGTTTDPGAGAIAATATIKSSGATSGVGYATGAGGAVTQGTSRTTGVTLDKVCGAITLFAAAPSVGTWVSFTVTNSAVAATDVPHVSFKSGTNTYIGHVTAVAAGSFQISFTSIVGTASDSPVINFAITKAVAA